MQDRAHGIITLPQTTIYCIRLSSTSLSFPGSRSCLLSREDFGTVRPGACLQRFWYHPSFSARTLLAMRTHSKRLCGPCIYDRLVRPSVLLQQLLPSSVSVQVVINDNINVNNNKAATIAPRYDDLESREESHMVKTMPNGDHLVAPRGPGGCPYCAAAMDNHTLVQGLVSS